MAMARVNINTANQAELQSLPGVSPSKAKAVIDYRINHGYFKTIEDIKRVKGFGDKIFDKIKSELVVDDVNPSTSTKANNADKKAKK